MDRSNILHQMLNFIAKYITNKQVDSSKVNNLEDFIGIGKVVWNFISTVYKANWDTLHTDNNSTSLKRKIMAKFIPKIQPTMVKNNKAFSKLSPVSIEKNPTSYSCQIPEEGQSDLKILQEQQTGKH